MRVDCSGSSPGLPEAYRGLGPFLFLQVLALSKMKKYHNRIDYPNGGRFEALKQTDDLNIHKKIPNKLNSLFTS